VSQQWYTADQQEEKRPMALKKNSLVTYKKKRHFKRTPEPKPKQSTSKEPIFVIQKHAASHLHYDLRLAIHGALVSWAVPKGVPTKIGEKRLAIQTEDHPMSYATFEGVIPKGEYGGGTVMVWDYGTYANIKYHNGELVPVDDALDKGTVEFVLHGKKLNSAYALIKTRYGENQWLLVKIRMPKGIKRTAKKTVPAARSALSGKTMQQIAQEG
jgi:bifunctional non-homologous end joining protein LigD